jgi:hypothetical protein
VFTARYAQSLYIGTPFVFKGLITLLEKPVQFSLMSCSRLFMACFDIACTDHLVVKI